MTIEAWLETAIQDAERRGLPELTPLLESLAQTMRVLRDADFNEEARGTGEARGAGGTSAGRSDIGPRA